MLSTFCTVNKYTNAQQLFQIYVPQTSINQVLILWVFMQAVEFDHELHL